MSEKSIARKHATYLPQREAPRPEARPHATFSNLPAARKQPVRRRQARPVNNVVILGTASAAPDAARLVKTIAPVAVLVCVLADVFVTLTLGLSTLLQHALHARFGASVFPLLLGGVFLILTRGQISPDAYQRLRRMTGLTSGQWTDHVLTALYILLLFFIGAIASALLAGGAAAVLGILIDW